MFQRLGELVSRHWLLTIVLWIVVIVVIRLNAPSWDSVTHDGDLAYMPASMPSVIGEDLLERAFPEGRSKSEAIVILSREDRDIDAADIEIEKSFIGRLQNLLGTAKYAEHKRLLNQLEQAGLDETTKAEIARQSELARDAALEAYESAEYALADIREQDPFYAVPAHNLAILYAEEGAVAEADQLRTMAWGLKPDFESKPNDVVGDVSEEPLPLLYVWTQYTERLGDKLVSKDNRANLVVLGMSNEFMAAENIPFVEKLESMLDETKSSLPNWPDGLKLGLSGSAAVGSDILRSAKESMSNTETYTILLVITILLVVYRSPVLIAVPIVTIVASLLVATSIVAQLTQLDQIVAGMEWWDFKIFTTTKIFVIVILFGAGTDYCLFLIARYKEELQTGKEKGQALADALGGVGDALAASAFTTIVGLATMYFAEFGKFKNSGPAIGLCLLVTLIACVTLAPALLRGLGKSVYWVLPTGRLFGQKESDGLSNNRKSSAFWSRVANTIVAKPLPILLGCTLLMLPFFFVGLDVDITYDLLSELHPDRISKRGAKQLRQHFHVGESGPLVLVAHKKDGDFRSSEGVQAIRELTSSLYLDESVRAVRSLVAPIGRKPKVSAASLYRHNHRLTREIYLGKEGAIEGDVTRLELVLQHDPFSIEAIEVLQKVEQHVEKLKESSEFWAKSDFAFAGTTAAIRDLREVTSADNVRIQWLVALAVLMILFILLRRPIVCIYLILSVLFSYYVTIGATELWFQWLYGETFEGLDWKVPLFLFVILVAIGQDYNIYLATRVFEEQEEHGLFGGLRQAVTRTGGIITSCGVIMAGTFFSMMTGSLRGIAELGFALTLGVLLDTFVVRPILVPSFLALLFRWYAHRKQQQETEKMRKENQYSGQAASVALSFSDGNNQS